MHALSTDSSLVPVFAHRGPFVTVYVDASRGPDDGPDVIDTRWAAVRETLDGAHPDSLDAIEESLTADTGTGEHGLVAVAAEGELCLSARLSAAPAVSTGFHTALPLLLPYLAARPPYQPNLVVVPAADGARVLTYETGDLRPIDGVPVTQDLDALLRSVARLASQINPDVIVVAGRADARARVVAGLRRLVVPDVTVRSLDVMPQDATALRAGVELALREQCRGDELAVIATIRENAGNRDRVVSGVRDVSRSAADGAGRRGAAHRRRGDEARCWVGPRPTEFGLNESEAASLGLRSVRHDLVGSALIRAVFGTGARLATLGALDWQVPHGVAALLR